MKSINEVLEELHKIIDWARENESPAGYFAAVYYHMTVAVQKGILEGAFENGSRMEQLDVRFAARYIDAFQAWRTGQPLTRSWEIAFKATQVTELTVIQHILLGINAHINLDLGIATAQTRPGDAVFGLRKDFQKINEIIAQLTDDIQQRLARIWLPFAWLDYFLKTEDEGWIHFSIGVARSTAWKAATLLAFATQKESETKIIQELDHTVAFLAQKIQQPGFWVQSGLFFMRRGEHKQVKENIDFLMQSDTYGTTSRTP